MPVFNEASTIADVVARVQAVPLDHEIVLVNDASSDGSAQIVDKLASANVRVIHHPTNRGKGAAICTALEAATGEAIVIQDADFEYDPQDLPCLLALLTAREADVVYGVRSLASQKPIMRFGNWYVTFITNLLYRGHLRDMETCYKMMSREIALSLQLECRRFDIEAEITAKVLQAVRRSQSDRSRGLLSDREVEVLKCLARGQTTAQIANVLFISENTVKTHIRHILEKMEVNNRAEAVARAAQLDMI